ncbi:hypothetical protein [Lactococcus lactis]|uniref:Uncharacterized protein n=1 Tax=Lactococcus lactis TaxID=1358 RepID=A0AAP3Z350_9LACT|nr:hypothetical protein [Lactococcus lactis]MDG4977472.1 hypothetical protein [Lactococcus lactis]
MEIANLIASIILTGLGILVSFLILRVQLREENKAVLVFEKDDVRNIGNTSALNVSAYRLIPNLGGDGTLVSLITNIGTIEKDKTYTFAREVLPNSNYDFFIIQYLSLNGKYYQQVYRIATGRGDAPENNIPVKVKIKETFPTYNFKDKRYILPQKINKLTEHNSRLKSLDDSN